MNDLPALTASVALIKLREFDPQLADFTEKLLREAQAKEQKAIRVLADAKRRRTTNV